MIFAEIHGKLGVNYSRANERAEDLLTSTAFGLLRYIPPAEGILALLRRVRSVRIDDQGVRIRQDPQWFGLGMAARVKFEFWPCWGHYGEPDVLLTLEDAEGGTVAVVLVEAKLHAPKSGNVSEEDDELADDDVPDPDQLVRYWQGLKKRVQANAQTGIIYLTKHGAPPAKELGDSMQREPGMALAWLSWRDVWAVAEKLAHTSLPAADLAVLLAHKGLKHFSGFHWESWQSPSVSRFWGNARWFGRCPSWCPPTGTRSFWKKGKTS